LVNEVKYVACQWHVWGTPIASIERGGKKASIPAVVGNDAADHEGDVISDGIVFVECGQLEEQVVGWIMWMVHMESWVRHLQNLSTFNASEQWNLNRPVIVGSVI
jgi:hypothetical protein